MVEIVALLLFVAAYFLISFESKIRTSKSAIALVAGGFLWFLVILSGKSKTFVEMAFSRTGNEILGIIMFLFASMALVEVLTHNHLFDAIREKMLSFNFHAKKQFIVLS